MKRGWVGFSYCPKCKRRVEIYFTGQFATCGYCTKELPLLNHNILLTATQRVLLSLRINNSIIYGGKIND